MGCQGDEGVCSEFAAAWGPTMSGSTGTMAGSMESVAKTQTNGRPEPLSPERLAELRRPAKYKTPEEKRAALKRATEGLRVKVRVTPDMYGRR